MQTNELHARAPRLSQRRAFWTVQVAGWMLVTLMVLVPSYDFAMQLGESPEQFIIRGTVWGASGLLVSSGLAQLYEFIERKFSERPTLVLGFVASLVAALLLTATLVGAERLFNLSPPSLPGLQPPPFLFRVTRAWLTLLTWSALFVAATLSVRVADARERTARAMALANEARLQSLRAQLNPHFLFNSLNSVIGLIDENPQRGQQMIRDMAVLLRRALDASQDQLATLRGEIEFVRLYVRCEEVRFEEKLLVTYDIPEDALDCPVPSMLLQPLVENAIKHGMQTSPLPLKINITVRRIDERIVIDVTNTGSLSSGNSTLELAGAGVGLRNIRERLETLYPQRHELQLTEAEGCVKVSLSCPDSRSP